MVKKNSKQVASKQNGMSAEIQKDSVRSTMEGIKTDLEKKNNRPDKNREENSLTRITTNDIELDKEKKEGRTDISDDIEKDINIDVNINNNTSCQVQYTSSITINYYNYETGQLPDSKDKQKSFMELLPSNFIKKLEELKTLSGLNENELVQKAYDLLKKEILTKQKK